MMHLVTGNTGAGKTTYSLNLKKEVGGILFSIDDWNKTLFLDDKTDEDGVDWFLDRIRRSDTMIQSLVLQLNEINVPTVLDLGFAKKKRREHFYRFAKDHKIPYQLHYLNIDSQTRKRQVAQRNMEKGETFTFEVSDKDFEFMETWFETPERDELRNAKVTVR